MTRTKPTKVSKKNQTAKTASVVDPPVDTAPSPSTSVAPSAHSAIPLPTVTGLAGTAALASDPNATPPPTVATSTPNPTPTGAISAGTTPTSTAPAASIVGTFAGTDPPAVTLPTIPGGLVAIPMNAFRGVYPNKFELLAIPGAVKDLGGFSDYAVVLGSSATPVPTVVDALTRGIGWRTLRLQAEAWVAYVRTEDAMAWQQVLPILEDVRPLFLIAAKKNPALVTKYASLAQLCNAAKKVAQAANVTRSKNAVVKAKNASDAALAAATAAGVATGKAEATAATTPATPPKAVTVNA